MSIVNKFIASIFKTKKALVFVLLFFILTFFIFHTVGAFVAPSVPGSDRTALGQPTASLATDNECKSNLSWYESIVAGGADILVYTPYIIAYWATWLSNYVISWVIDWPITNINTTDMAARGGAQAFINGWISVRDLANMLIVLGFVIIGIATTLRIRDYEAKKFLGPLIIVALLVNFSNVFVGLVIDASRITMNSLLQGSIPATMGETFINGVIYAEKNLSCQALNRGNLGEYIMIAAEFAFIYLAVAISFFYLAFILIARYAVLGILFMLSPLAFVFWAFPFPKAKDLWNKWWENFIKWAFIGVGISFFLNLAGQLLATYPGLVAPDPTNPNLNLTPPSLGSIFFYLTIILITLIVGIKVTTKTSAIGAAAVMGLAGGVAGLAMGAAGKAGMGTLKGLGGVADKATGGKISGAGRAISSGVGHAMENLGLRKEGTTAMNRNATAKKEEARYEALFAENPDALKNIVRGKGEGRSSSKRAAAANVALKNSAFDTADSAMINALPHFKAHGYSMTEHTKKDPNIAQYDPNITSPMAAKGMAPKDIAVASVRGATMKMGVDAAGNLSADNLTPAVASAFDAKKAKRLGEKGSIDAIEEMKKYKHDPSKNLAGQSSEWVKAKLNVKKSGPVGSSERVRAERQWAELQTQLATDANFA